MRTSARLTLLGALLVSGAASVPAAHAQIVTVRDTGEARPEKPSADLIVQEQLRSRTFPNAYTAIEALRGNWLRIRNLNPATGSVINPVGGATGSSGGAAPQVQNMPRDNAGIQVYIDGVRAGGLEALRAIPVATIYSIRRISGTAAQARFGIGHSDGVIYVSSAPGK